MLSSFINTLALQTSMEEAITRALNACKLARELESNLPAIANQPNFLRNSLEQVVGAFREAIHVIQYQQPTTHMIFGEVSGSRATDIPSLFHGSTGNEMVTLPELGLEVGMGMPTEAEMFVGGDRAVAEGSPASRPAGSWSLRTSKKRKDRAGDYTVRVPAPRTGNSEIPPDDGYTWRKYGQKDILGSRFPRSYYRCTHKNFYGCEAKKKVQRLDDDPYTYEVTYRDKHTCQTSTTPLVFPSLPPPAGGSNPQSTAMVAQQQTLFSTSVNLGGQWFPVDLEGGRSTGESSGVNVVHGRRDAECPVADLADAMLNSGSGGTGLDAIFSLRQDHWKNQDL